MSSKVSEILKERGSRYGTFQSNARLAQALKRAMREWNPEGWGRLDDSQKEALEMVAHKVSRIINGDPNYLDNYIDGAGYFELAKNTTLEKGHSE